MSVPLATLRRHGQLVWLNDPLGLPAAVPRHPPAGFGTFTQFDVRHGERKTFWDSREAEAYLRFWLNDVSALMALRGALQKSDPSGPVHALDDAEVLRRLAARLARGAVVLTQSQLPPAPAVMPVVPPAPAVVDPPAVPVSQLLAPAPVPVPPLLPLLEEVQIEGAEVLPEIEQSLAQVDLTIAEINLAPVSLEPTPSKVPEITTAMDAASASVTTTLDGL